MRCQEQVVDRTTGRMRKCKKKSLYTGYCCIHTPHHFSTCCFCGEYCNIGSQSCGYCARKVTMFAIGMLQ